MNDNEKQAVNLLVQAIENAKKGGDIPIELDDFIMSMPSGMDQTVKKLITECTDFIKESNQRHKTTASLAMGSLEIAPMKSTFLTSPIKQLNSDLKHLVWQTQRIAKGDYSQRISFLGDFSAAFNQLTESLKDKKALQEKLKNSNITKDKFFSIIAHDLKNPFNVILGLSKMLIDCYDRYDDTQRREFIRMIHEKADITFKLLEHLLLWARAQRSSLNFNPEKFDLKYAVNDVCALAGLMIKRKDIQLNVNVPEDIMIFSDRDCISTILRNLVTNAVKFTDRKGVITLRAFETEQNIQGMPRKCAQIEVEDTGLGMSQDKVNRLFKIEESVSTAGTDGEDGTGLGLVLCHELISLCKGSISVESTLKKGTCFTVSIPLDPPLSEPISKSGP
jgi:signal transduction histidine kinase